MARRRTPPGVWMIAIAVAWLLMGSLAAGQEGTRIQASSTFPLPLWGLRIFVGVAALSGWFWTQSLLGKRTSPSDGIRDELHRLSAPLHSLLLTHPRWADGILIGTSSLIDLLGIFILAAAVFGPTIRPLLGLLILFSLRQLCQGLCALPSPAGMIWRNPGFPSLLVTYGVANDLFFSGHTAIAVYGALELGRWGGPWLGLVGGLVALLEAVTVIVLRAHYTMDVFAAVITALYVAALASQLAPVVDHALARLLILG